MGISVLLTAAICRALSENSGSCNVPQGGWDPALLSQCLQGHGEGYSQFSLTKAFLPFREHDTNVTKIHEGPCKESVAVSAI